MKIQDINIIFEAQNILVFIKGKKTKVIGTLTSFVVPGLGLSVGFYFLSRQKLAIHNNYFAFFILLFLILSFLIFFYLEVRRAFLNAKDYSFFLNENEILINDKKFCEKNLCNVFVQPVMGWKGYGESFTVGLIAKGKKKCVAFDIDKENAKKLGSLLADFLNIKIKPERKILFAIFRGF